MGLKSSAKQLQLIRRNILWWGTPLPTSEKLGYYGHLVSATIRTIFNRKRKINYLGKNLHYDNVATPLSLQVYPHEIYTKILANISGIKIKKVLDLGGNIGQFSLTLSRALNDKPLIDIFEPNPDAFELLRSNVSDKRNIRIFNFGVGKPSHKHLYYKANKSASGSVSKAIINDKLGTKKTLVKLINNIPEITGRYEYDLVKVDVEGYEYSLIEAIEPFRTKLMFLEISGLGRNMSFRHSDLFNLIEKKFGKFNILHLSGAHARSDNFDALFRFI